jgi:mono/diheme cytochrome c family protein
VLAADATTAGQWDIPAATLTQLQSTIFTPICSSCHAPGGDSPNLTSGNSYASIVNVASTEQPSLLRIKPGDPDHSYLVLKAQGSAGISGVQMPALGTLLTQAQVDGIRSWVTAGALNN